MKRMLGIGALVTTALTAGVANAEPITVGKSNLVIDVEFWGRQELRDQDPNDVSKDIITYGDPVQGKFRIFVDDAPRTTNPTAAFPDMQNAVIYGRHPQAPGDPPPASFVTSNRTSPSPGSIANDFVTIGDRLPFRPNGPLRDWFEVDDVWSDPSDPDHGTRNELFITVSSPLDFIQGTGLEQEFDLVKPAENGGNSGGFFRETLGDASRFMSFIVDRLHVTKSLACHP